MSHLDLFDRKLVCQRQGRALASGAATFLLDRVAADMAERLSAVMRTFEFAVDLGTPTDALVRALAGPQVSRFIRIGANANRIATHSSGTAPAAGILRIVGDEEALPIHNGSIDLLVSALGLQFVNDLPGALLQIRLALKPDGLFLAALIGGDSLSELRQAFAAAEAEVEGGVSPHVVPFVELRQAGALLQRAGFALPVADVDRLTVRYDTPFAVMHDLRRMGATNPLLERRRAPLRRTTLMRMAKVYHERFADPDGRVRATFDIVWLSGWAPHASQQKPLRPGSAAARLADALGAQEISTGVKSGR
jgi:SAM-dependent methyltransferase